MTKEFFGRCSYENPNCKTRPFKTILWDQTKRM